MKTSKRILSFFLAVVMALTACSAGFVAFARETNPKDNNPFSDEFASADKSIDALNGLLDSLLPTILDAIGEETLASIGLDKNKIVNASFDDESIKSDRFYELISELSVYLFGLIGKTSMETVLNNEGLASGDAEKDAADYAYLLDEDAKMDFWTIYNLCKSNAKQDGTEFEQRCNDYYNGYKKEDGTVVTGLKDLLFARSSIDPVVSLLGSGANKKVFDLATELGIIQKVGDKDIILNKSVAEIQALIDAYEAEKGTIPAKTDDYDLNIAMSNVNYALEMINASAKCTSLADLIFYQIIEEKAIFASIFNVAAIEGGADTGVAKDAYNTWYEDASTAYTLEAYIQDTFGGNTEGISEDVVNGMYRQALADRYSASIIENKNNLEADKFYAEYVTGLLSLEGYSTKDETAASVADLGLRAEDIEWLMTNPSVPACTPTADQTAAYPNVKPSTATKALGNTNAFYNTLVLDIAERGFSDAVRNTFAQYTPAQLATFRSALRSGNANALETTLPAAAESIKTKSYTILANDYIGNVNSINLFGKKVAAEYADTLIADYSYDGADYPFDTNDYFEVTAATIDGYINMAKDLDGLLGSLGVELELGLNDIVSQLLASLTQTTDKDGNPLTYELVIDSVDGIYSNLAKDPMGTIANVIPLLAILLDEVILPLFINAETDAYAGFIQSFIFPENGILHGLSEDLYNTIMGFVKEYGIEKLSFDLNKILPALTNYMATGSIEGLTLYDGYTTSDGRPVPSITTVRYVDELIAENCYNCKFLDGMDAGMAELLKTIIGVLNKSVNDYISTHNTNETADARLGATVNGIEAVVCAGLNNIGVALPELINLFVKNFLALYNTKGSDWQFNSRNSHSTGTVTLKDTNNTVISVTEYGTAENATISALKQEIFNKEPSNVTAWIVNLIVNDWLNAVIDLLNDVFTTDNDIKNNIPIVTTLLNSLGGFGETSVISDVLNGLFYLSRSSDYSFAFSEQNIPLAQNGETYVGLSDNSAYYLIANVGPIIEIVMSIVNAPPAEDDDNNNNNDNNNDDNNNSPVVTTNINIKYSDAAAILTAENEKASATLISALDTLLSTVFENTYFNGYTVDKLDGILSGLVAFLINHFGNNTTDKILNLVIKYLEVICNESIQQKFAPKRNVNNPGAVNEKKVYSNKELSILVTETYSLLEEILDDLIDIPGDDNDYIVNAIDGVFSPSSIAVRSSLNNDIMEFLTWSELSATKYSTDLGFDFKAGDKDAFYDNLFEALAPVTAILGALLSSESTGLYDSLINPIFSSICNKCGIELYTPANTTGKEYAKAIVFPVAELLNQFLQTPATTLVQLIQGLSNVLTDKSISSIVKKLIPPITGEIRGLGNIVAVLSPELSKVITDWKIEVSEDFAIDLATIESLGTLISAVPNIVNTLLTDLEIGSVKLNVDFDWAGFANLSTGKALLVIYDLALNLVLDMGIIQGIEEIKGNNTLLSMINKLDAKTVFETLVAAIKSVRTPTEILWTFENYLAKETNTFKYPSGITASSADDAVDSLDNLVKNIFPLLQSLGVLDYSDLSGVVNGLLFKNDMLTTIATAVYGGIEKAAAKASGVNFTFTPAQFADYLMDKSYGNTYSEAAAALRKCTSWSQVKNINWGFTDGSAKAEQGFINGLAALCRPANDVLAVLLAGGELKLGDLINTVLNDLELVIKGKTDDNLAYTIVLRDGALGIYLGDDKPLYDSIVIKVSEIAEVLNGAGIMGGNGYQSAIIPLLEALMCDGVKTNAQYINDYNKAKDNLIINILNPLFSFVDKVLEKPFDTITAVLPNIAYFIDNNGIGQLLNNLLSPITQMLPVLKNGGIDVNAIIEAIMGESLGKKIAGLVGINANINLNLNDLNSCDIQDYLIQIINAVLKSNNINITLPDFKWSTLASHGTQTTFNSAAGGQGIRIVAKQGETLVAVLRYLADTIISNANELKSLICGIDGVKNNKTIVNILTTVFNQLSGAHEDDIVKAIFYFLTQDPQNRFFDYRDFQYKDYDFSYPSTVDVDFLTNIGPMLDGLVGGLVEGGLNKMIGDLIYKDDIISSLVCGLYGAVEGVKINDNMNLAELLAQTDIDFTTSNVAKLLTDKDYGQTYASVAKTIEKAGSWSKVNKDSLHWGVTDRDSFVHALCAALRPIYGVLDVLLNDGSLGLFKLIYLPGTDGYTSAIVPLMEAFGLYNIKTQYQYRQDMSKEYDAILLDILNPLLDKVEDILNAPIEMLCDILPNLSLFFANDGLLQLIDNLLLPITALLDSLKPIVDVNALLKAVGLDIEKEISKLGLNVKGFKFDIYNLSETLKPLIGAENIVGLLNSVLGLIKIGGSPLGIELMPIDWFQLASHGELITDEASQAATFGSRMYVKADQSEVLIAVLRYLVNTINYGDNFNTISNLIGGLLPEASDSVSDIISQVLGMLSGDTDEVISSLCELLKTLA